MIKHLQNKWLYYLGGVIILAIILFEARGEGDFYIFISASRDLLQGKNVYTTNYNEWFHYYYDIIFLLILAPFTYLPLYFTKLIWLTLNVFFVYRIWRIIIGWLPVISLKKNSNILFGVLSFIFVLSFLRTNFHLAQVTIFILYLSLEGLFLIDNNKAIAGSLLIALGINIKLLPILMIPYLIYRNEWKAALYIIGFIVILLFLPMIFIGVDYGTILLVERWHLINPMNNAHILDTSERSFHSLTTLLATLFVKDCGDWHALTLKRNIADISIDKLNIIINIVRGALLMFTLYFLRTMPFKRISFKIQKLYEISYICLIIPLIFPHQQHYAFFFIFPASTYLLFFLIYNYYNDRNNRTDRHYNANKYVLTILLIIIYFLTNSHFILGQFNNIYDHYKTLTYGVILLMILLAIYNPDKLIENTQRDL